MTNDPDNHAEDSTGRRAEHRAGEASDSHRRRRMSCMSKPFTLSGTTDTRTLSMFEIVFVAVTVLGTPGRLADGAAYPIATPAPRRVRHGM